MRQYTPTIEWTKPLTPIGPSDDPKVKFLGTVSILGADFHAEADEVGYDEEEGQIGKQDESETYLAEVLNIVDGAAQTIRIDGREYVLSITPYQR